MLNKKNLSLAPNKSNINNKLEKAQNAFNNKNFEKTIVQCNFIIRLLNSQRNKDAHEYYRAYYLKGMAMYNLSKYQKSLHCFNKCLESSKDDLDCLIEKAKVLYELGNYVATLKLCDYIDRRAISGLRGVMSTVRQKTFIKYIKQLLENNNYKKYFSFDGNRLYGLKNCIITISKDDNANELDYYLTLYEDLSSKYICDINHILYIFNTNNKITIITKYAHICIDGNSCFVKEKLSIFTLKQLEKHYKPVPEYPTFFKNLVDENAEYGAILHINPLTEFEVYPVFNMNVGDTIIAEIFTTSYSTEFYTYIPGMYEVLFNGECIGYVLRRDDISINEK